jgi:hypothetical protein
MSNGNKEPWTYKIPEKCEDCIFFEYYENGPIGCILYELKHPTMGGLKKGPKFDFCRAEKIEITERP